jgi:hypothetical protein
MLNCHIEINQEDKHKMGIVTPFGKYLYERLAYGLAASPFTFIWIMDEGLLGLGSFTYLVFGKTTEEQTERLRQVFERL